MSVRVLLLVFLVALSAGAAAQTVRFVDADATGADDGTSWADAFVHLRDALAAAEVGDEVWVAEGTYRPTDGGPDPDDRTASFVLPDGVGLYGGFDGTEAARDERDWEAHATVLSGDIGVPSDSTDNSYHVVVASGVGAATVLDGLTVERGRGGGAPTPDDRGAGLYALNGSPVIRNTTFRLHSFGPLFGGGDKLGGGIYVEGGSPLIEDCLFEENVGNGGGIYASGGEPIIRRTTFRANVASGLFLVEGADALIEDVLFEGNETAGLRIRGSSPVVRRTTFRANSCGPSCGGGAVIIDDGLPEFDAPVAPLFEDCLFEGNTAVGGGGAVEGAGVTPAFVRTTFRENVNTGDSGGAVYLSGNDPDVASPALFLACRFERNRGRAGGGLFAFGAPLAVVNTAFVGNRATSSESGGGGAAFLNTAPASAPGGGPGVVFANVVVAGNDGYDGGGLLLANLPGAARFVHATIAGNRSRGVGGGVSTFDAGGLSFANSVIWGNTVPAGAEDGVALFHEAGEGPALVRSLVEGGCPPDVLCEDILDGDPLFARPPHPGDDGNWGTADDDYGDLRLVEGSPGVDAGLAALLPADRWDLDRDGDTAEPLPVDLASGPRVVGVAPDLGAYEGAVPVSAEDTPATGERLALSVYPNPARGAVTLRLDVPSAGRFRVGVYDVLGREVAVLHDGPLGAGEHRLPLRGADLPAGVYLLRFRSGTAALTRRLVVL